MRSDLIERLKQCVDMADVISYTGDADRFDTLPATGKAMGHHCTTEGGKKCLVRVDQGWWHCVKCGQGGGIVAWVLTRKYKGDKAQTSRAVQDIARLASLDEKESTIDVPQYDAYAMLTSLSWEWHHELLGRDDILQFIKSKWGLTLETIEELRIGYCDGVSKSGYTHTEMLNGGLIDDKGQQPLNQRITFPYFADGQVVWFSGRQYEGRSDAPKYKDLVKTEYVAPTLYNFDNARLARTTDALLFVEGVADAARAFQDGYRVVATGGANRFGKELQDATKELLVYCTSSKYICYDSEKSGAGLKGAKKLASSLITMGHNPLIVELPRDEEVDKVDLCDFLNTSERDRDEFHAFDYIVDEAWKQPSKTLPNLMMEDLPEHPSPDLIKAVLKVIAKLNKMEQPAYIKRLSELDPESDHTIRGLTSQMREVAKENKRKVTGKLTMSENYTRPVCLANDYKYIEDLNIWRVHTATYAPYEFMEMDDNGYEQLREELRLVCISVDLGVNGTWSISKHDIVETQARKELGIDRPDRNILTLDTNFWPIERHSPYSFRNFIEGSAPKVDLPKLYQDMYNMVDEYVWLPYDQDKTLMVLYAIFTYVFMGFDGVPYIHFRGEKGTGKSTSMDLMSYLCFNTMGCSSLSEPILFRMAHCTRPTLMVAESEKLDNPAPNSSYDAILSVCLEGYANSANAAVYRCNTVDITEADLFKTYGPRVFGSIKALKDTLTDRSITIHCRTTEPEYLQKLKAWAATKRYREKALEDIRSRCRVWALTQFRTLRDEFDKTVEDKTWVLELSGRAKEIYQPLLALAMVLDKEGKTGFYNQVLEIVLFKVKAAKAEELEHGFANQVLKAVHATWMENRNTNTIGYVQVEAWGGKDAIALDLLLKAVKARMMMSGAWDDRKNSMDIAFLRNILKNFGAIPDAARRTNRKIGVDGSNIQVIEFDGKRLEDYVRQKGIILVEEEQG